MYFLQLMVLREIWFCLDSDQTDPNYGHNWVLQEKKSEPGSYRGGGRVPGRGDDVSRPAAALRQLLDELQADAPAAAGDQHRPPRSHAALQ